MKDSSHPEFWNERYASNRMPWDLGGVPSLLVDFLGRTQPGRVLIPGCGTGYEARAFARSGWQVDAVDFSPEAVRRAKEFLGEDAHCVRQADFFGEEHDRSFDLVYERTFLCSPPKSLWPSYSAQVRQALCPGGCLAGFFFFGPEPDPPPYPLGPDELAALLGPGFVQVEDLSVPDSLPLFQNKERWQVWKMK
jgi:SAM-dependent methyltransferase